MSVDIPHDPDWIAVIVVNYGTADLSIKAVRSVLSHARGGHQVTVHLVDNASPGEDAKALCQAHADQNWGDRVILWLQTENHGFGGGNNVALRALQQLPNPPDKVFLLNPDAALHNDAIARLAAALDATPGAVAAGAAVLHKDLSPTTAAFRFPGWRSEFARILAFGPLDRLVANQIVALSPDQPAGPVDWVSGAAVMFQFEILAQQGFFDPGFFLYYEEVDLMRRLQAAGGCVLYVPDAKVVHVEGAATGQFASALVRQRDPWYLYQSWTYYFTRAFGRWWTLAIAATLWPAAVLNILHRRLRGKPPSIPKAFFRDHWTYVIRPLLSRRKAQDS